MPGLITHRFYTHNAEQFYESLGEAAPTNFYMFIGRSYTWGNTVLEAAPPTPTNSLQAVEYDPYRDIFIYKKVQGGDISYASSRYNWSNNTFYTEYDDANTTLHTSQFYTITADRNVYKCLDNNRGANTTVSPTGTGTSTIQTSDGYRWKYLYTVSSGDLNKFATTDYIPVKSLSANDSSAQWSVQQAAANGAIEHIKVTANGSGYLSTNGTFSAVTNSTVVLLAPGANTTDSAYVGSTIFIDSGLGASQLRNITTYVGGTLAATVNGAFTTSPNTSSTYIIGPKIIIQGDSGATALNRATAYVSNCTGTQVRNITMVSAGLNYSLANVTISDSTGTGATARPIISPPGGHGAGAVNELYGHNVMISVYTTRLEDASYPSNNDFRMIGLVRDPVVRSTGAIANTSIIDGSFNLTLEAVSGDFIADEIVTGDTSATTGRVIFFANTNTLGTKGTLKLTRIVTNGVGIKFISGETITANSGVVGTITAVTPPLIREYTGDIIYIDNKVAVARGPLQSENMKLLIKY